MMRHGTAIYWRLYEKSAREMMAAPDICRESAAADAEHFI